MIKNITELDYKYISSELFESLKGIISFLLVTVTEVETNTLHTRFKPLNGYSEILVYQNIISTYYVAVFGKYVVCNVASQMGSIGAGASIITIQKSIEEIGPKAIIMVGIAFGVDRKKQKIGDVLVSDLIISYESKKVGSNSVEYRDVKQMPSILLLDRFKNVISWRFPLTRTRFSQIRIGNILSGEVLIDNPEYLKSLTQSFPTAIGGEMEGAGMLSAAHSFNVHWILVKAICDFADGNKSKNKKVNQSIAAKSAVDLCYNVLSNEFGFSDINIHPAPDLASPSTNLSQKESFNVDRRKLKRVLFNAYFSEAEPYYLQRTPDEELKCYIDINYSIWIFGGSGFGKTAALFRNILISKCPLFVIDLSSCNDSLLDTFNYIAFRLAENKNIPDYKQSIDIMRAIDYICIILNRFYNDYYIILEETPINDNNDALAKQIMSMIINYSNKFPLSNTAFAITSIGNPLKSIPESVKKISEKVQFIELPMWSIEELINLINLILHELQSVISDSHIIRLAESAYGNPRFIKSFLFSLFVSESKASGYFENSLNKFIITSNVSK